MQRRQFLQGVLASSVISTGDWLRYFKTSGVPGTAKDLRIAQSAAAAAADPHYLIYWFIEGGWDGYSMFNPISQGSDLAALNAFSASNLYPSPGVGDQVYRPRGYGTSPNDPPRTAGNIQYGFLAEGGVPLMNDLAIVSSHHGNQFHSGGRWDYHYGMYDQYAPLTAQRGDNERTVLQAFCEAYGASYVMPHISWHRWLADGELSLTNFPEGTGYSDKAGNAPSYANTQYGKTPSDMRNRLLQIQSLTSNARDNRIRQFVDNLHANFLADKHGETTKAFASAVQIHQSLVGAGTVNANPATMFTDPQLRSDFNITADDESATSTSVNNNPARSKESPNTNVQALMTYELMTKGLSIGFFLESRDIRGFDSHFGRTGVRDNQGQQNQRDNMNAHLWNPLVTLVNKLKSTQHPVTGKPYFAHTTIVLASEMGRTLGTDAASILADGTLDATTKYNQIMDQDVCQHWYVSSVAFLGGNVKGNAQYGKAVWPMPSYTDPSGQKQTPGCIPLMPNGSMDPAFDVATGALKSGAAPSPNSFVTDAGHVYATALHLSGLDPNALKSQGKGLNARPPLTFIHI